MTEQKKSGRAALVDIFCRVIDNYGDAGVCWRLARALSLEEGFRVTLYIDKVDVLSRIEPLLRPGAARQEALGISVRAWDECLADGPGDAVVETFGCRLPDAFEEAIAKKSEEGRPVVWLNLEYLSAEDWVEECHGLPSPHPRLPVTKTFLFPGVTPRTGGIIIEKEAARTRDAFSAEDREALLSRLGAAKPTAPFNLFFFSYPSADAASLARALASDGRECQVVAAPGEASDALGREIARLGSPLVTFSPVPAVPQRVFDRLLLSCNVLIIRGEDSFARAQVVSRPFLWTIYPQDEEAHIVKLEAFLGRLKGVMPPDVWEILHRANLSWNTGPIGPADWSLFRDSLPALAAASRRWTSQLEAMGSLSRHVAEAIEKGLKLTV